MKKIESIETRVIRTADSSRGNHAWRGIKGLKRKYDGRRDSGLARRDACKLAS